MSRLIDADKMIEHLDLCLKDGDSSTIIVDATLTAIKCYVENAPTVDAVEVVRCKECIHFREDGYCKVLMGYSGNEDWFCASGRRK